MTLDRADNRPKDLGESELRIIAPPPYFQTHKASLMLKSTLIILIKL